MKLSEYGVDAVITISRRLLGRVVARAFHTQNLALFSALPRLVALFDHQERRVEPNEDWFCRFGDAWFEEREGEAKLLITLETATGAVSLADGPAAAQPVTLVGDVSFSRGAQERQLLITFVLAGQSNDITLDLRSIEIDGLGLSLAAEAPAVAKALPDGSAALGLVLDAEFDIAPLAEGASTEAQWIHGQRSRLNIGPRGDGRFSGWPTLQPPPTDLSLFSAFDVDLLDLDQNYVIDWAVAFDDWIIDAVIRLNVIAIEDTVRLRLRLRDTSPQRLRLTGDGSGEWSGDWWDIDVRADATLGFASGGGVEATYEVTRARADVCDKDLLSALQDSGAHRGTLRIDLPTSISPASSPFGALRVNTLAVGSGWIGVGGGAGITKVDPPEVETDQEVLVPRPLPGHSLWGQLWVRNRRSLTNSERLPLQVGAIRIEGDEAARFTIEPGASDNPQPRIEPGDRTSFRVSIDENDGLNHEVSAVVLTTGGRRAVPVRFLLAPPNLSAEVKRGGTVVRELGCGSGASVPTERSRAAFRVLISNSGPGAAALASLSFPALSRGAWWIIAMDIDGDNERLSKNGEVWHPPGALPALAPGRVASIYIGAAESAADGPSDAVTSGGVHGTNGELMATLRLRYSDGDFDVPLGAGSLPADVNVGDDLIGNFGVNRDHMCAELAGLRERAEVARIGGGLQAMIDALQTSCCPPPTPPNCTCIDFIEMEPQDALDGVLTLEAGGRDVFEYRFESDPERLFIPWPDGDPRVSLRRSSTTSSSPVRMKITRWTASREQIIPSDAIIEHIELAANGQLGIVDEEGRVSTHQLWDRPSPGMQGRPRISATSLRRMSGPLSRPGTLATLEGVGVGANRIIASTSELHLRDPRGQVLERLQLDRPLGGMAAIRGGVVAWDTEGLSLIRHVRDRMVVRGSASLSEVRGVLVAGNTLFALGKAGASTVFRLGYRDLREAGQFALPAAWAKFAPRGAVRTMGLWAAAVSFDGRSVSVWRLRRGRRK